MIVRILGDPDKDERWFLKEDEHITDVVKAVFQRDSMVVFHKADGTRIKIKEKRIIDIREE